LIYAGLSNVYSVTGFRVEAMPPFSYFFNISDSVSLLLKGNRVSPLLATAPSANASSQIMLLLPAISSVAPATLNARTKHHRWNKLSPALSRAKLKKLADVRVHVSLLLATVLLAGASLSDSAQNHANLSV